MTHDKRDTNEPTISMDPLFTPNGAAVCNDCGARLTAFGGRLVCVGCESGKEAA